MKFTMMYREAIWMCLDEVEIDEERLVEDFGSVENFLLWSKNQPDTRKEKNLLKKLIEKFPLTVDEYVKSVGSHTKTFKGKRMDEFKKILEGGLDQKPQKKLISEQKKIRFQKQDGSKVGEIKVGFT